MEGEHKTSCWMGPLLRGTDEQRRELKRTIMVALRSSRGNLERAAGLLGVHTATLRRYVVRMGLDAAVDAARPDRGAARAVGRYHGVRGGRPPSC